MKSRKFENKCIFMKKLRFQENVKKLLKTKRILIKNESFNMCQKKKKYKNLKLQKIIVNKLKQFVSDNCKKRVNKLKNISIKCDKSMKKEKKM